MIAEKLSRHMSGSFGSGLKPFARSAEVVILFVGHLVQQRPSKYWSNSGQSGFGHTTSRHKIGSALLFIPMPPDMPFAQERSSGTLMSFAKHNGQHVPVLSGAWYSNGGLHSNGLQEIPVHVSTEPAPGEYTGYRAVPAQALTISKGVK